METTNNTETGVAKYTPLPLPKIEDLYADPALAKRQNELSRLLNSTPRKEWLKPHPTATREVKQPDGSKISVPVDYMPIGIIEYLAASIFIKTRTEVKNVQLFANSVVVTVRVWVLDPVTGDWDWQEGVGAAPIRTNKGAAATDFSQVQTSAVQTATPAAKTFAEKDAFEKFGKLFGRDLNRAEDMLGDYLKLENKFPGEVEITPELRDIIAEAETPDAIREIFKANPMLGGNIEFIELLDARKEELRTPKTNEDGSSN